MPTWAQIVIAIVAASVNGGALLGFWTWCRAQLYGLNARVAVLETEAQRTAQRFDEHREDIGKVFNKLSEVAERLASIEGKLS